MKLFKHKIVSLLILSSLLCFTSKADEKTSIFDSANAFYSKGMYEKAIQQYEKLLGLNSESSELYYNLGNAYFKNNQLGRAILNFERAKKLNSKDEDLIFNLKLVNQKTEDKIDPAPQLFLTDWKNGIINLFSEKAWSVMGVLLFSFSLISISVFLLSSKNGFKKLGFFSGIGCVILTVFSIFVANEKHEQTINRNEAIITSATATITGSPNVKGTKLFILHEGTKVEVTQEQNDWTEIKIANGNVGWIKSDFLEKI
jgi:tetratricopeptide (TPR) repeat protein